jgi:hypothetical protein
MKYFTLKGQLSNQSSKIYKLQCVLFLGFGNFKNYSERFPHTACIIIEIVQMEYKYFLFWKLNFYYFLL